MLRREGEGSDVETVTRLLTSGCRYSRALQQDPNHIPTTINLAVKRKQDKRGRGGRGEGARGGRAHGSPGSVQRQPQRAANSRESHHPRAQTRSRQSLAQGFHS
eukprot:758319-Hanusia_phi.AAC.2